MGTTSRRPLPGLSHSLSLSGLPSLFLYPSVCAFFMFSPFFQPLLCLCFPASPRLSQPCLSASRCVFCAPEPHPARAPSPVQGSVRTPVGVVHHDGGDTAVTDLSFAQMKDSRSSLERSLQASPYGPIRQDSAPSASVAGSPLRAGRWPSPLRSALFCLEAFERWKRKKVSSFLFIWRQLGFCSCVEQISLKNYYGFCFSCACRVKI